MSLMRRGVIGITISAAALVSFIKVYEGDQLPVYPDMLAGGLPTVCSGHTGPDVVLGQVWTPAMCDAVLIKDVENHGRGLLDCITAPINQHEYEAFASLAFNTGVGAVCGSSIPGKLARGDHAAACKTILEFDQVRDRTKPKVWSERRQRMEYPLIKVRGLTRRREAEFSKCMQPMPVLMPVPPALATLGVQG